MNNFLQVFFIIRVEDKRSGFLIARSYKFNELENSLILILTHGGRA